MTTKKIRAATEEKVEASRRDFVRRAAYVPPAILTLAVAPSFAKAGSQKGDQNDQGQNENGQGQNGNN